ncbi:MAG: hypothetical protein JOZ27_09055 [Caulobacteraceae bacterium]|nr:hypothetical protein [Caulobacteraceae bacterium]
MTPSFDDLDIIEWLETAADTDLDELPFGVIALTPAGVVASYNRVQAELSGIAAGRMLGRDFFASVGACADNDVIRRRLEHRDDVDETVDYVVHFQMGKTPVRVRFLRCLGGRRMYLLVTRKDFL